MRAVGAAAASGGGSATGRLAAGAGGRGPPRRPSSPLPHPHLMLYTSAAPPLFPSAADMAATMATTDMADELAVESCAAWGGDGAVTTTVDEPAVESYAGLDVHEHPLAETARRATAWTCDMPNCGKSTRPRYRCRNGCDFDLCASCWLKGKERHAL